MAGFEKIEINRQLLVYKKCVINKKIFGFDRILMKLCEIVLLMSATNK